MTIAKTIDPEAQSPEVKGPPITERSPASNAEAARSGVQEALVVGTEEARDISLEEIKEERRKVQMAYLGESEWEMPLNEPCEEVEVRSLQDLAGKQAEYKSEQVPGYTLKLEVLNMKDKEVTIAISTVELYEGKPLRGYIEIDKQTGTAKIPEGDVCLNNFFRNRFQTGGLQEFGNELLEVLIKGDQANETDI